MNKKIIIVPGSTDLNRGDQAIAWVPRYLLEDAGIKAQFYLLESGNDREEVFKQSHQSRVMNFKIIKNIVGHPGRYFKNKNISYSKIQILFYGIVGAFDLISSSLLLSKSKFLIFFGFLFLNKESKLSYNCISSSHMVIVKGGGFVHSYNKFMDLYRLYMQLFPVMLALNLGKKVAVMPNSFGPVEGNLEKKLVRWVLKRCSIVYSREMISRDFLRDIIGISTESKPDLGFFLRDYSLKNSSTSNFDYKKILSGHHQQFLVGITLRPYRFPEYSDGKARYEKYIHEMTGVVKNLIERRHIPVLIAHTLGPSAHEDDRVALQSVMNLLTERGIEESKYIYIEDEKMNCFDMSCLYSKMDFLIGTRFHSVIFSLNSLVPCIAISYSGNKTPGIMKDMDLDEYFVKMSDMSCDDLMLKYENLIENKIEIQNKIRKYLCHCEKEKIKIQNEMLKLFI